MPLLSTPGLDADIRAAERAIVRTTGMDPRPWFRCPFGAGTRDPRVLAALERRGYREVPWDVECSDWRGSLSGREMARQMLAGTMARGDGAVLLLHPWTMATDRGLGRLIQDLSDAGAAFVRIDALATPP
jgi:peptidoglycan/xylan/chitin deacetylase (PgdA/CDA1 family)